MIETAQALERFVDGEKYSVAPEEKTRGPGTDDFRKDLERVACEKVNSHFWMSGPNIKQREATPALLHSAARHGALARARHWCWFYLYRHAFMPRISTTAIGHLYDRDHTTVLYGIKKIDYSLKSWPGAAEAQLLRAIAEDLAPDYGAFLAAAPRGAGVQGAAAPEEKTRHG